LPTSLNNSYEDYLLKCSAKASNSLGRAYSEKEHPYRSPFQRDRDRIVHSSAFRRLESKTQVYTHLYQKGDQYRKRLTHSLEVAGISRNIAKALRINEDLCEAIALAHDIGHSPFGHRGQDILHELMKEHGGFEHNTQALRIVSIIESRYPGFKGLNLTFETREGIAAKGHRQIESLGDEFKKFNNPSIEAQVVNLADPIAYSTHDLDDGLTAGTISNKMLEECAFWDEGAEAVKKEFPDVEGKILQFQVIRYIINEQVTDLINTTAKNIKELNPQSIDDIRNSKTKLVSFSETMQKKHKALKVFLRINMYDQPPVRRMEHKAKKVLTALFDAFLNDPSLLSSPVQKHFFNAKEKGEGGEQRIICDYIAGMTDRFALNEYNEIFNPASSD